MSAKERIEQLNESLNQLRQARQRHNSLLGDTFHHKSAEDLARLSSDPELALFVSNYVYFVCHPDFKEEYERAKQSLLEQKAKQDRTL